MTEPKFNSSTATRGVICLPDPIDMRYPIKITAVHTKAGTTCKAGTTTLYSAMDATGKMLRYSHDAAGEVIRCHIAWGDIVTEPKDAFDIWLFERVQKKTERTSIIQSPPPLRSPKPVTPQTDTAETAPLQRQTRKRGQADETKELQPLIFWEI